MPRISLSEIVPYTPEQIYDLVVDMERYPEFLPWCIQGRKLREEPTYFLAEMSVAFSGIREKFQTMDHIVPGRKVDIKLVKGPFTHLESAWSFTPVEGGARIDFFISFQFKSGLLNMTLGPLFSHAAKQMVAAFCKRAAVVYK